MPDDPHAAVAEPENPAGPSVPEAPVPPGTEAAPKPPDEREPPKGVSGTPEGEDKAEEQPTAEDQLREILGGDLELAEKVLPKELLDRIKEPDVGEERAKWDRERTTREAADNATRLEATFNSGIAQIGVQAQAYAEEMAGNVRKGAEDLKSGGEGKTDLVDSKAALQRIDQLVSAGMTTQSQYVTGVFGNAIVDALQPAQSYLNDADRAEMQAAAGSAADWVKAQVGVAIRAIQRAAPAEQGKAKETKTASETKLAEALVKLQEAVGKNNGKTPRPVGGTTTTKPYKDRLGELTPEQIDAETAEFVRREGG